MARKCPECGSKNPGVLTGDQAKFNTLDDNGRAICVPCKVQQKMYGLKVK